MEEEEPVVLRAADQRLPAHADEPVCVLCGRFGAYVCDATDEDVCSIECRDACVQRRRETRELRRQLEIRVSEGGGANQQAVAELLTSFEDCAQLPSALLANMRRARLETPTPVQMQVVPSALARANLLVVAPTGTGKTAAYVVPILARLVNGRSAANLPSSAVAVVLVPIRELAIQIEDATKLLALGIPHMRTALLVGGVPMPPQLHRLRTGVQVIIATPGRFIDIFSNYEVALAAEEEGNGDDDSDRNERRHTFRRTPTSLASTVTCVVDEVDVMLDVGFHAQVCQIIAMLPPLPQLQLLFFSATLSSRVESLVQQILGDCAGSSATEASQSPPGNYLRVEVGGKTKKQPDSGGNGIGDGAPSSTYTVNANICQKVVWAEDKAKKKVLFDVLRSKADESTLVFVRSKIGADMLAAAVAKQTQIPSTSIHADKSQQDRLLALEAFVNQEVRVLVSTNVLSRGMDLLHVDNVVVFDFPSKVSDYIHLIGRVARGSEATGNALAMVNEDDKTVFKELIEVLRASKALVPREIYQSLAVDAKREAFKTSTFVVDEAKRAFRICNGANAPTEQQTQRSWHQWSDQTAQKRLRKS